jgi:hypothetical protein
MVHQQSKIFYRSGAGTVYSSAAHTIFLWSLHYLSWSLTLRHTTMTSLQDHITMSKALWGKVQRNQWNHKKDRHYVQWSKDKERRTNNMHNDQKTKTRLYPRGQMVHQQSKIFYRSGAGKLKWCQWWNTDYALGDKWFTSRVRYSTGVVVSASSLTSF